MTKSGSFRLNQEFWYGLDEVFVCKMYSSKVGFGILQVFLKKIDPFVDPDSRKGLKIKNALVDQWKKPLIGKFVLNFLVKVLVKN